MLHPSIAQRGAVDRVLDFGTGQAAVEPGVCQVGYGCIGLLVLEEAAGSPVQDVVALMFTTGARAGEVVAMEVADLKLRSVPPTVIIRRGKGGKGREIPLAVEVAAAIDRYLRARKAHRLASDPALWLGDRGKYFSYDGLHKTLAMRAAMAGVTGFHPHRLRHTAADRWLSKGGSESGLMAVAGWTKPDMLHRYTKVRRRRSS